MRIPLPGGSLIVQEQMAWDGADLQPAAVAVDLVAAAASLALPSHLGPRRESLPLQPQFAE